MADTPRPMGRSESGEPKPGERQLIPHVSEIQRPAEVDSEGPPPEFLQTLPIAAVHLPDSGHSFGLTDVGCVRKNNQDAILVREKDGLWLVADGMGGHFGGEIASRHIVEVLQNFEPKANPLMAMLRIEQRLSRANERLKRMAEKEGEDLMGTTVVLCLLSPTHYVVGWIGDSRCYAIRQGSVVAVTRDHCTLEEGLEAGLEWDEVRDSAAFSSDKLSRAIGAAQGALNMDWRMLPRNRYSRLLLCSDGLYKAVPREEIFWNLKQERSAEEVTRALLDAALGHKCRDNVSVIVIDPPG